ncbi:hypothetical protein INS49_014210 [Diaporthe citri]|uniref:uncharacterized protein n=1 Tax=Diaporthe citri TaxID=83186 RepID=UPI001C7E547F|nr:uncharacterized protein INS49_014210 [Diaporthe citri]KAG6358326.1 hypothetical protein INS49_014210 [Diaporthe citri]
MGEEEWKSLPPRSSIPLSQPSGDSEWTIYEIVPGHFINISACFSAFNFEYRDVHMTAAGAITERSTPWSLVLVAREYNMQEVETYLGLDPSRQAIADRGILDLQVKPDSSTDGDTTYPPPPPLDDLLRLPADEISPSALMIDSLEGAMHFRLGNGLDGNVTFQMCMDCTSNGVTVHMDYACLFSSVLFGESSGAGRAADALSAVINLAGFNVYDQYLASKMDFAEQVRLVTTLEVIVPGSWPPSTTECAGFIAVASLLVAHLAVVTGITVLYVRHRRYSRYGNVWHAISQLVASEELEETLELGNNASDKAVVASLRTKKSSQEDVLVKLGKTDGCENIKVCKSGT